MIRPCLRQFAEPVPTCYRSTSLDLILSFCTQNNHARMVVIDERHRPIGLVHLASLLAEIIGARYASGAIASTNHPIASSATPLPADSAPLIIPVHQIEPVAVFSAETPLDKFWSRLPSFHHKHWVIVDQAARYTGLLNAQALMRDWAIRSQVSHPLVTPPPIAVAPDTPTAPPLRLNEAWLEVFNHVPTPLMLQTQAGQVLVQNTAWKTEVGDLQYPDWMRQEATTLLSHPPPPASTPSYMAPAAIAPIISTDEVRPADIQMHAIAPGSCQAGEDANTCFCACITHSGLIRIWRFVKLPLDLTTQDLNHAAASHPPFQAKPTASLLHKVTEEHFQLAQLQTVPVTVSDPSTTVEPPLSNERLWLLVAQDTTEQRQLSKELAAKNADLVQLNRFKDEFLACISHELKTPLTAVLGLSQLLKDQSLGSLNERQARYARLIHDSGRHLMAIVNDILDLTRIETQQLELCLEPISIAAFCQQVIEQIQRQMPTDSAVLSRAIHVEIEPGVEMLLADEHRLRQMLTSLLSNALKFTDPEGEVGLEVKAWDGWIAFTVWDTGIGIPADKQHLIFQKFQQLENPMTRRYEGTGLGLVLTQRLARLHGGDVTFVSTEGRGSRFTLLLPPAPPDTALNLNLDLALSLHVPQQHRLALIIESGPRFLDDLTAKLMGQGYRVTIARSGPEAIEKTRRLQPRIVFLNPLLPLLSGWDVLTLLKSNPETQHIPIVITATPLEREQAKINQADGFLTLPIDEADLGKTLEKLTHPSPDSSIMPLKGLTILYLGTEAPQPTHSEVSFSAADLNHMLHQHHCRLLEVDDLDQAEMLARVWQPDVILLHPEILQPTRYLQELSHQRCLASLPLITLTAESTQAANQIPQLSVFPCLSVSTMHEKPEGRDSHALLQVIQIAAGLVRQPHILVFDAHAATKALHTHPNNQRQALLHYLRAAGMQGSISDAWQSVYQQVQSQTVDLLLIYWRDAESTPELYAQLQQLSNPSGCPPVFVLDYRDPSQPERLAPPEFPQVVCDVLPASISVRSLLDHINQVLQP